MRNYNRITSLLLLCWVAVFFSGCSQNSPVSNSNIKVERISPYSIISSGNSSVNVALISTYIFMPDMHKSSGVPKLGGVSVNAFLDTAINKAMVAKGYRFAKTVSGQSFLVGYQVVLGDPGAGDQLGRRMGMQPGLQSGMPVEGHHKKGTLTVSVKDSDTGRTVWRSALQGFADLDIPARVRQQRINEIVARMLSGLPLQRDSK